MDISKSINSFLFKYWLPLVVILILYVIIIISICYSVNLKNHTLEKKTGVIQYFNTRITPADSWTWYTINFKIEGDSTLYTQEWRILNYSLLYNFLLGHYDLSNQNLFKQGVKIEFHKDINTQFSPSSVFIIKDKDKKSPREDRLYLENNKIKMVNTYGLVIRDETIFDYKKRGFTTQLLETLLIGVWLLLVPIFLISLIYISDKIQYFINKIPNKR